MSWTMSYKSLNEFEADRPEHTTGTPSRDTIDKARGAAQVLIASKVVGDKLEHDFTVYFSGHENPGHRPTKGMSNDSITVTIHQKAAQ